MRPLIVDSFAGGGGASTGIFMALGRSPDIAINHSAAALALHEANHPETRHLSKNIYLVDPLDEVEGKPVGLAWFSPDCKDFSKAKGSKPVERNIRDLAWVVVSWAMRAKPRVILLENVEEFRYWGPLIETENGLQPCPDSRGKTFNKWKRALRKLGYVLEFRELRACDYGTPTSRNRLFMVARCDGEAIVWPAPTHGDPDSEDVIAGRKLPWRTAAEIMDWSLVCPSIFDSKEYIKETYGLQAKRPLADNSMARVARGIKRHVLDSQTPFLINLTHGGRVESGLKPLNTITGAHRGEKALIAPSLQRFNTGVTSAPVEKPLPTIMANSFKKRPGGAPNMALLAPVMTAAQHGGSTRDARKPHSTIAASRKDQNSVIAASFVAREFGNSVGHSADEPLATTMPKGGGKSALVAGHVSHFYTSNTAGGEGDMKKPLNVITAGGNHAAFIAPHLNAYYGTDQDTPVTEPMHALTTKPRFSAVHAELSIPPFTADKEARARQVADFLRAHGVWDEREFVTIEVGGITLVLSDIGMRMLTPRELYRAQGFPDDYQIEGYFDRSQIGHDGGPAWVPFPKHVQISCVGNSVCPPVAAALVAANCSDLIEFPIAA